MKKKLPLKTTAKKQKKGQKDITTTSIAFKTENLRGLKECPLHAKHKLSVSWIVNKLSQKFLAGEIDIPLD